MNKNNLSKLVSFCATLLLACGTVSAATVNVVVPFETSTGDTGRVEFSYLSETAPFFQQDNGPERRQSVYRGALTSFRLYLNDSLIRSGVDNDSSMNLRDFGDVFGFDDFNLDPAFGGGNAATSIQIIDDSGNALNDGVNPLPSGISQFGYNRGRFSINGNQSFTEFTVEGPVQYTFNVLYDDVGGQFLSVGHASINDAGLVAFQAFPSTGGSGIYVGDGGPTTAIAESSGPLSTFFAPSINNTGTVVFKGRFDSGIFGVFTGNGGALTTIDSGGQYGFPTINDQGTVAFFRLRNSQRAILKNTAGQTTSLYTTSGPFLSFQNNPAINNSGNVAFQASLDVGGSGVFIGDGITTTTISDTTNGDFSFVGGVTANNSGTVAFLGVRTNGEIGIFTGDGGPITTIAESSGPYATNFGTGYVGDDSTVVFKANLDGGGQGLFVGPDPIGHKVIATGDILDGLTVQSVSMSNGGSAFSINASGQFVFRATLSDGRNRIVVASPGDVIAPTAIAGANQAIHAGQIVNLDGSGSFDDTTPSGDLIYGWSFSSTPLGSSAILTGADTPSPSFVADVPGTFVIELVVEDEAGNVSIPVSVEVSSENVSPQANAGDDTVIPLGTTAVLDGTASVDADSDPLVYNWTISAQPTGSTAELIGLATDSPTLMPDLEGQYSVDLTVSDGFDVSVVDNVIVTAIVGDEFAEIELMEANDVVVDIPVEDLQSPGHSQSLTSEIARIINFIQKGQISQALSKLDSSIERTDGCILRGAPDPMGAGSNEFAGDWVTDCSEQTALYELLIGTRLALEQL